MRRWQLKGTSVTSAHALGLAVTDKGVLVQWGPLELVHWLGHACPGLVLRRAMAANHSQSGQGSLALTSLLQPRRREALPQVLVQTLPS